MLASKYLDAPLALSPLQRRGRGVLVSEVITTATQERRLLAMYQRLAGQASFDNTTPRRLARTGILLPVFSGDGGLCKTYQMATDRPHRLADSPTERENIWSGVFCRVQGASTRGSLSVPNWHIEFNTTNVLGCVHVCQRRARAPALHRWLRFPPWGCRSAAVVGGAGRGPGASAVVACC